MQGFSELFEPRCDMTAFGRKAPTVILRRAHNWNYIAAAETRTESPICEIGPCGFLAEWSRLSCCGFGSSEFSDDPKLLHQA
jgi:hypothetical protein